MTAQPHSLRHGMCDTSEYRSWYQMKSRCYDPNNTRYEGWGGRGIKVCDRWRNSFKAFYEDMGPKPTPTHSIDRVDNDGDYTPDNCRWATRAEQQRNKRMQKNNTSGFKGVCFDKTNRKWLARISVDGKNLNLGSFDDPKEASQAYLKGRLVHFNEQRSTIQTIRERRDLRAETPAPTTK